MKKILRKWARWFFLGQIRVYRMQKYISPEMIMWAKPGLEKALELDMVRRIADKMYEEGLIEFVEMDDHRNGGRTLEANFRSI